jgi:hypothetical protein
MSSSENEYKKLVLRIGKVCAGQQTSLVVPALCDALIIVMTLVDGCSKQEAIEQARDFLAFYSVQLDEPASVH